MSTIELRGGLLVRTDAIALALALEFRGVTLFIENETLKAKPGSALTPEDLAAVKTLRMQLMAIAGYEPPALG